MIKYSLSVANAERSATILAQGLGTHKLKGMTFVDIDNHVREHFPNSHFESRADITEALLSIQTVLRRTGNNI